MTNDAKNRLTAANGDDRDALVSAYALDQLQGSERDAVKRLLADPAAADLRRSEAESRAVAAALRAAQAADEPPRSPDLRRAVVAALAAAGQPATPAPAPRSSRGTLSGWLALACGLAATALVAVTVLRRPPDARAVARTTERDAKANTGVDQAGKDHDLEQAKQAEQQGETVRRQLATAKATDKLQGAAQGEGGSQAASGTTEGTLADEEARAGASDRAMPQKRESSSREKNAAPAAAETMTAIGEAEEVLESKVFAYRASASAYGSGAQGQNVSQDRAWQGEQAASSVPQGARQAEGRRSQQSQSGERYAKFQEHRFTPVADRPLSTFSIDVDTASYAVVRRFLTSGRLPPQDAVRIEEFVNYFSYAYPQPQGDDPFAVAIEAAACPWQPAHRLVRIGIAGRDIDRAKRPAGNLVFLVDVSGSMDDPDKLPLVKQALAMLVSELTENDRVSIVTYAGDAGLKLPPTSGDQKRRILDVIEGLSAGGSTHGSAGIELAYAQARERFIPGGANRVILCTDGDLNVGVTSDAALVDLITEKARGGTFLTVLGFGQGNLQDEKMEKLADKGNGVYAYVDGVREARKVLVEQLTGSTITIAKDVKLQVEFNPAQVASYRLVGYENRQLADADFRDDKKDAGDIGAGHTVTAIYEIVPAAAMAAGGDGPGRGAEPLKYQPQPEAKVAPAAAGPVSRELLTVKLRFKQPEGDVSVLREYPLADAGGDFAAASADTRFAAAVAAFGMLLRGSDFAGDSTFATVARLAGDALGPDAGGYRAEFLDLVRKAEAVQIESRGPRQQ